MISKIGAAVTIKNMEPIIDWLCEEDRPIEIQDFTLPNILTDDVSDILRTYQERLKPPQWSSRRPWAILWT